MAKLVNNTQKVLVGFIGWAVLLLGLVMIPYPGPGWVVVFIGLSILATEFQWASDLHRFARSKYDSWQQWQRKQPWYIRALFWVLTCITVIVTVWLVNGYGMLNAWLGLGWTWLESPFVR